MSASPTEGTDMNQIEKVARALCRADPEVRMGDADGVVEQRVNIEWVHYVDQAKAAIAAMPVQAEPVAWMYERNGVRHVSPSKVINFYAWTETPLYAHSPAPQWQGIESAPRDWTDVLVFSPKHSGFNCGGVFSAFYDPYHPGWFAHGPDDNIPLTPTHWMPLPTPPAGGSDAE